MGARRVPPVSTPSDPAILGYLAGLVDGEGNITISRVAGYAGQRNASHSLMVQITNTDVVIMAWLIDTVGGAVHSTASRRQGWKPIHVWKVYGDNAEIFLRAIQPYLIIKRAQCEVALRFRLAGSGRHRGTTPLDHQTVLDRDCCRDELMALNRKGLLV